MQFQKTANFTIISFVIGRIQQNCQIRKHYAGLIQPKLEKTCCSIGVQNRLLSYIWPIYVSQSHLVKIYGLQIFFCFEISISLLPQLLRCSFRYSLLPIYGESSSIGNKYDGYMLMLLRNQIRIHNFHLSFVKYPQIIRFCSLFGIYNRHNYERTRTQRPSSRHQAVTAIFKMHDSYCSRCDDCVYIKAQFQLLNGYLKRVIRFKRVEQQFFLKCELFGFCNFEFVILQSFDIMIAECSNVIFLLHYYFIITNYYQLKQTTKQNKQRQKSYTYFTSKRISQYIFSQLNYWYLQRIQDKLQLFNNQFNLQSYIFVMHHRYESQPFQVFKQINHFSPLRHSPNALKERNDFQNLPLNYFKANSKVANEKVNKIVENRQDSIVQNIRTSYLNAPIKKIWESDWTLIIPETHKENGNLF